MRDIDDDAFGHRPSRGRSGHRRRDYLDVGGSRDDDDRFDDADEGRESRERDDTDRSRSDGKRSPEGRNGGSPQAKDGSDKQADGDADSKKQKDQGDKDEAEGQQRRKKRRPLVLGIAAVVILLLVGGGIYYWLSTRGKATTDDAYTDGNIVTIAPQVSGQVVTLDVTDNQFVHKGDPLFHIDARQYVFSQEQAQGQLDTTKAQASSQRLGVEIARKNFPAALELAKANLDSAKSNLQLQQANYDRQKSLPKLATTQQEVDTTASNLAQAKAQVEQAQARVIQAEPVKQNIGQSEDQLSQIEGQIEQAQGRLDQAKLNVEWSVVRAPQDGWVTRRNVNAGNYISAGQQVMSLVTTDVWVTANYKETELNGMHPGQKVTITVDAYPDLDLHGHVDSIQRGSGSKFSAFPAENATGNFIKIVQRVPVKIVIDSGLKPDEPLPLGISVEPTVMLK
ncbi:HlyD family secretion protein [Methylobacterium persicinum]|uniref:Membrane fusion protein (Multidrug efflux system) n=1 Tax=Methylobacterium persicinum TaxID=374426 RepID=A0ABU0HH87_9HYPH|nr:HlyD family secretion protein [Methylobacterium persicinum]MDQ0440876.1 membrane fusion protein (multidrug efflux system) [Methylobacterium persicinum]GJE39657.1 p-hydroxybenzoic acid efflux pump subunit AaeA [Methylobacterium persicinum]